MSVSTYCAMKCLRWDENSARLERTRSSGRSLPYYLPDDATGSVPPIPAHKGPEDRTLNGILRTVAKHKGVERQEILDSL
jgi:hypothetical protein